MPIAFRELHIFIDNMKDLYKELKGSKKKVPKKDFKESLFDLVDKFFREPDSLTDEDRMKVYQLRRHIDLNFKDW